MKELQEHLRQGETVRWQGKPKAFPLLEEGCKNKIIRNWILMTVSGALLLGLYIRSNENPSMGFISLVVAVVVLALAAPAAQAISLRKQQYFITDQRAIVLTGDKTFYYMELNELSDVEVIDDCSSSRCLAMGAPIMKDVRRQLRWQAKNPKIDVQSSESNEHAIGMVFYDPDDVDGALLLLKEDIQLKQKTTPLRRAAS
ncbi:MAG: hypothetical protein LKJ86_07870 [Oscillibacter sp.]|jgi:hypothetical protein|nr:hypothetical protein [Oscillibacter sp.]